MPGILPVLLLHCFKEGKRETSRGLIALGKIFLEETGMAKLVSPQSFFGLPGYGNSPEAAAVHAFVAEKVAEDGWPAQEMGDVVCDIKPTKQGYSWQPTKQGFTPDQNIIVFSLPLPHFRQSVTHFVGIAERCEVRERCALLACAAMIIIDTIIAGDWESIEEQVHAICATVGLPVNVLRKFIHAVGDDLHEKTRKPPRPPQRTSSTPSVHEGGGYSSTSSSDSEGPPATLSKFTPPEMQGGGKKRRKGSGANPPPLLLHANQPLLGAK